MISLLVSILSSLARSRMRTFSLDPPLSRFSGPPGGNLVREHRSVDPHLPPRRSLRGPDPPREPFHAHRGPAKVDPAARLPPSRIRLPARFAVPRSGKTIPSSLCFRTERTAPSVVGGGHCLASLPPSPGRVLPRAESHRLPGLAEPGLRMRPHRRFGLLRSGHVFRGTSAFADGSAFLGAKSPSARFRASSTFRADLYVPPHELRASSRLVFFRSPGGAAPRVRRPPCSSRTRRPAPG